MASRLEGGLTTKQLEKLEEQRRLVQDKITSKYGEDYIIKKKLELCDSCKIKQCRLIPVCLDKSDCPYWSAET